jgi:hypothetical protein
MRCDGMARWFGLVLLILTMAWAGCRQEQYYGPYLVAVPTQIQELSAAHTFKLPLDGDQTQQARSLNWCMEHEPNRQLPCVCDLPVRTADSQALRVDYQLIQGAQAADNVMVWVGVNLRAGQEPSQTLLDLPFVDVLAEHLYRIDAGENVRGSFLEDEMRQLEWDWSAKNYPECKDGLHQIPAPTELLIGITVGSWQTTPTSGEITIRIRERT